MAGKVVHFEIPVDDGDRAVAFYARALGWGLERWGPLEYWTTAAGDGDGIGGALTRRMAIPTVGWSALFEDTEGNRVGLFQDDPSVSVPDRFRTGEDTPPAP